MITICIGDTVKFEKAIEYIIRDLPRDLTFTVENSANNIAFLRDKHGYYAYAHVNVLSKMGEHYECTS